jgi:positive regulator of sigma E activity
VDADEDDDDWLPVVARSVDMTRDNEEATASGIYGVIVSAAVMTASQADTGLTVVLAVLGTLVIYWGAERYSRIVAERIHEGHHPSWTTVRHHLTHGWEMVTASTLPLVVLAVLSALDVELSTAVLAALGCSTALLCVAGWAVGRHGRLSTPERVASSAVAGMFGILFILLKTLLH